ncbi:MAG: 16S rRNA (cytosine(967)-C(5))-methyltransferase RsmB [Ruminococcus sp.]|nr:16S rRNA (cytosine(967)-C(5))-methyltransferase RsmB [Ruminococcus sp.]
MSMPRKVAFDVLYKIQEDEGYSSIVVNKALCEQGLKGLDSAFASAIIYGVLEKRITLDYVIRRHSTLRLKKIEPKTLIVLRMGAYQLLFMDKVPDNAAVNESVKLVKKLKLFRSVGFVNAVLRGIAGDDKCLNFNNIKIKEERFSVQYSVPIDIIKMWLTEYGEKVVVDMLKKLDGRPPLYARVNTEKTAVECLAENLHLEGVVTEPTVLPTMLKLSRTGAVEQLESFKKGEFYIQDLSSNIAVTTLCPKSGEVLYDVCSAPGGKAFASALLMKNHGVVRGFDLYPHRVGLIEEAAKRLGLGIVKAEVHNALAGFEDEVVDVVICDVPCSGLGLMRRKPEIRYKENIFDNSLKEIQYEILTAASKLLKKGGRLMYSTCTLNPDENGHIVEKFLNENNGFVGKELVLPDNVYRTIEEKSYECTLFPQTNDSDGFYFAVLKRVN